MSGEAFSRMVHLPLEEVLSRWFNRGDSQTTRGMLEMLRLLFATGLGQGANRNNQLVQSGFLASSMRVVPTGTPDFNVTVRAGIGFQDAAGTQADGFGASIADYDGHAGLDDLSAFKPLVMPSTLTFVVPAPPAPLGDGDDTDHTTRWDLIEIRCNRRLGDAQSLYILDPITGIYALDSDDKALLWTVGSGDQGTVNAPADSTAALSYKKGVADLTDGVFPSPTTGYLPLAYIRVSWNAAEIDWDRIMEARILLFPWGQSSVVLSMTIDEVLGTAPTILHCSAPPSVEVYAVADASTVGLVWVYVLSTALHASASVSVGQLPEFETDFDDSPPTDKLFLDGRVVVSAPRRVNLDQTYISDVLKINSARNGMGATKTCKWASAHRFAVWAFKYDPGTGNLVSITAATNATVTVNLGAF